MNSVCNSIDALRLKPLTSHKAHLRFSDAVSFNPSTRTPYPSFTVKTVSSERIRPWPIRSSYSASTSDIDMVRNKQGVYTPKENKVVVLWDLDNKPPRGSPYDAAVALRRIAERFGRLVEFSAYANRHAFIHLPQWVVEERRERRQLDILERKGVIKPSEPYVCGVCGRKCKTNLDLKKHFRQLHERERQKKLNRMKSLKGKKRQNYKERFISGNHKYNEAMRSLVTPKVGYGLAAELRRAGVYVKTVEDKPQAADWALKRQMQHSMTRGIDWLFLVSDDKDFTDMLRKARAANLGTVVVGDRGRALGPHADFWVPWIGVENGEIREEDLVPSDRRRRRRRRRTDDDDDYDDDDDEDDGYGNGLFSVSFLDKGQSDGFGGLRISAFSEGEDEEEDEWMTDEYDAGDYWLGDDDSEDEL